MVQDNEDLIKLRELLKGLDHGMLTTSDEHGNLHSRPMLNNGQVDFDGDIWFFSYGDSDKCREILKNPQVNVAYASPDQGLYVSTTGKAEVLKDLDRMKQLWESALKKYFPGELEEPGIVLIHIEVEMAEYWHRSENGGQEEQKKITLTHLAGKIL